MKIHQFISATLLLIFSTYAVARDLAQLTNNIREINREFEAQYRSLDTFQVRDQNYYYYSGVANIINATRNGVVAEVRRHQLDALNVFVETYFDEAKARLNQPPDMICFNCVTEPSADQAFYRISRGNRRIGKLKFLTRTLEAQSVPSEANVMLYIRGHDRPSYEVVTNGSLGEVYVGYYNVLVRKQGYKIGSLRLDLITNRGDLISCKLAVFDESESTTYCRHLVQ